MAGNWKAVLKMTLENTSVVKGLRDHEKAAKGATTATERTRDASTKLARTGEGVGNVARKLREVESAARSAAGQLTAGASGGGRWTEMASKFSVAGSAMEGLKSAAGAVGSIFKSGMNLENLMRSLAASTEDTETLEQQMDSLRKVASGPGIDLNTAIQGSAALQSVGMSAEQSREALTQWSNVVATAGGNAETLQGVLLAIRQIMTKPAVMAEDTMQILERVPQFARIGQMLEPKKGDPKAYIAGAVAELAKLPRVAAGSQEAVDGLADSWDQFKVTLAQVTKLQAAGNAALNFSARILSADFRGAFGNVGQDFHNSSQNPVERLEPGAEEIKKRQDARAAGEKAVADRRQKAIEDYNKMQRRAADEHFAAQRWVLDMEREIADVGKRGARAKLAIWEEQLKTIQKEIGEEEERGSFEGTKTIDRKRDQEAVMKKLIALGQKGESQGAADMLRDELHLLENTARIAKELGQNEDYVREKLQEQLNMRREIEKASGQREGADAMQRAEINEMRSLGHDKKADKAEEELRTRTQYDELRGKGVPEAEARKIADRESSTRQREARAQRRGHKGIRGAVADGQRHGLDSYNFSPDSKMGQFTPRLLPPSKSGRPELRDRNAIDFDNRLGLRSTQSSQHMDAINNARRADRMAGAGIGAARTAAAGQTSDQGMIAKAAAIFVKTFPEVLRAVQTTAAKSDTAVA